VALWIKICGITSVEDAEAAITAGADALGVNLIPSSKRAVDLRTLESLLEAVGDRIELVAVVADQTRDALLRLRDASAITWLQLHGEEPPEALSPLLPHAYKAIGIADAADVVRARAFPGERLLVDAKVTGALGGTGTRFDWELVRGLSAERQLIVAGGLSADNVADAVLALAPFGVDVASGVESGNPRRKDPDKVRRFVQAARAAGARLDSATSVDYEPSAGRVLREEKP
jgi:phosphoribosylanthranilate isomerase